MNRYNKRNLVLVAAIIVLCAGMFWWGLNIGKKAAVSNRSSPVVHHMLPINNLLIG